jgi:FtsH-binding integral membrane protein
MMDYTKSYTGSQRGFDEGLRNYMLKIYNYMAFGLVITGIAAFVTIATPISNLIFSFGPSGEFLGNTGFGSLIMFSPLIIGIYFFWGFGSLDVNKAQFLFWIYSMLTGMSLSSLSFIYTGDSIASTFFICSGVFGAMSLYGYTTKRDLTSVGSFLRMGLFGLIIASFVNILLKSPAISYALSILGVIIFIGLIAWDTQKLKSYYYSVGDEELRQKLSVLGAFVLYLDFINLFLYLIRFFGVQRKN